MEKILTDLGLDASAEHSGAGCGSWLACKGTMLESVSPIDGHKIGRVKCADRDDYETVITRAIEAFEEWRTIPTQGGVMWYGRSGTRSEPARKTWVIS